MAARDEDPPAAADGGDDALGWDAQFLEGLSDRLISLPQRDFCDVDPQPLLELHALHMGQPSLLVDVGLGIGADDVAPTEEPHHVPRISPVHHRDAAHVQRAEMAQGVLQCLVGKHGADLRRADVAHLPGHQLLRRGPLQVGQSDHPVQLPLLIEHHQSVVMGLVEDAGQFGEGCVRCHGDHPVDGRHRLPYQDGPHQVQVLPGIDVDPPSLQFEGVDALPVEVVGDDGADDRGQHQGEDDPIILRHLEEDEDGGDRCAGGGGEDGRHPHQRVGGRYSRPLRHPLVNQQAEDAAEHRANEQGGGEDAAGAAGADGDGGCQDLEHGQQGERREYQLVVQDRLDSSVPHAEEFGEPEPHQAHQQSAGHGLEVLREAPGLEEILKPVQDAGEAHADEGSDDAEQGVDGQFPHAGRGVGGDGEGGDIAEVDATNDAGGDGGDDHGGELHQAELGQDDLQSEHHPGDRGVEGGGDPGRRAARDQVADPSVRQVEQLADGGAQGGADLDDGPFAADRPAAADADGRCQRLDHDDDGTDAAAAQGDGFHHLGYAVPLGLAGQEVDHRSHQQATEGRDDDDVVGPHKREPFPQRVEEEALEGVDEPSEEHRAEAAPQSYQEGHRHHYSGLRGPKAGVKVADVVTCTGDVAHLLSQCWVRKTRMRPGDRRGRRTKPPPTLSFRVLRRTEIDNVQDATLSLRLLFEDGLNAHPDADLIGIDLAQVVDQPAVGAIQLDEGHDPWFVQRVPV